MATLKEARFDWYERVRIVTADPAKASISGRIGAILGRAQNDDGLWSYAVAVYGERLTWSCFEDELASTGEFDCRESFYP